MVLLLVYSPVTKKEDIRHYIVYNYMATGRSLALGGVPNPRLAGSIPRLYPWVSVPLLVR